MPKLIDREKVLATVGKYCSDSEMLRELKSIEYVVTGEKMHRRRTAETIGDRMLRVRRLAGLTQTEFAERVGSARKSIAEYERCVRLPSLCVAISVAEEFHISLNWLLLGEGERML